MRFGESAWQALKIAKVRRPKTHEFFRNLANCIPVVERLRSNWMTDTEPGGANLEEPF
jgi:hypothetical protein